MGRIARQQPVVHIAARADMSAPEAASPDAGEHRTYHTNEGHQAYHGEEPAQQDVGDDNPVER